jgi:hypothetical protein
MAADFHLMRLSEADHFVTLAKVVTGSIRPQHPPLHGVFSLDLIELASQGGGVRSFRKL